MKMPPLETFSGLAEIATIRHGFVGRVPEIDVRTERALALARLDTFHAEARNSLGLGDYAFITADQVHGSAVAVVDADTAVPVAAVDGLITTDPRVCLGIYTADCAPVFLVDPRRRVIALLHSGRRGTELGIAIVAIEKMTGDFGCAPADLIAQIGPCIRPPHYEVDIAARIIEQCREAGVPQVFDCGRCTASDADRYYSYRRERGKTGRLLALLALR